MWQVIKYIFPRVGVIFMMIFSVMFIIGTYCFKSEPIDQTPYFKFDKSKDVTDILYLDYETGEVFYRTYGTPPSQKYKPAYRVEDIIYDSNLEIEDLIDYALD